MHTDTAGAMKYSLGVKPYGGLYRAFRGKSPPPAPPRRLSRIRENRGGDSIPPSVYAIERRYHQLGIACA